VPSDGEQFGELSLFDFNKYKTDYIVIGSVNSETFNLLLTHIEDLEIDILHIAENL
jgi:hypothetical protein